MITGRPRSSKLLPVPPEHGHLCGEEEEEAKKKKKKKMERKKEELL